MIIGELVASLGSDDQNIRYRAKQQLILLGAVVVEPLVETMLSSNRKSCWMAAKVLAEIPDERIFPALIEGLQSSNIILCDTIVAELGKLGDKRAVPHLISMLDTVAPFVKLSIAHALGMLEDTRAVEPLLASLAKAEVASLKYNIIEALGQIGDPRAIAFIEPYINDEDHHIRSRTRKALSKLQKEFGEDYAASG